MSLSGWQGVRVSSSGARSLKLDVFDCSFVLMLLFLQFSKFTASTAQQTPLDSCARFATAPLEDTTGGTT